MTYSPLGFLSVIVVLANKTHMLLNHDDYISTQVSESPDVQSVRNVRNVRKWSVRNFWGRKRAQIFFGFCIQTILEWLHLSWVQRFNNLSARVVIRTVAATSKAHSFFSVQPWFESSPLSNPNGGSSLD